jgi:hypothetical protein
MGGQPTVGSVGPRRRFTDGRGVDDLYRRLGERFLTGEWQIAVDGYRRLLGAAIGDIDSPDGALVGGSDELVREGMIRLVRALLADRTIAPAQRAAHVVDVMDDFGSVGGHPRLDEVLSAHPEPIDDIDEALAALGARCEERARAWSAWDGAPFHELALDVAVARDGPDALARLARDRTMTRRDRVWERWMTDRVWPGRGLSPELGRDAKSEPDEEPSPLSARVIGVLEHVAPDPRRATVAADLIETVAAEVMSNKWRSSYALVARLVVALASAIEASGRGSATTVVAEYDRTYRRFSAFRKELAAAASGDRLGRSRRSATGHA